MEDSSKLEILKNKMRFCLKILKKKKVEKKVENFVAKKVLVGSSKNEPK